MHVLDTFRSTPFVMAMRELESLVSGELAARETASEDDYILRIGCHLRSGEGV
jgi:hypothetical protein